MEAFVLSNKANPTWRCPVCNNPTNYEHLFIDEFFENIIKEVGVDEERESVKIYKDGTWELFDIEYNSNHSESDSDSDQPAFKKRKLNLSNNILISNVNTSNISSKVIDLTL